MAIRFVSAAQRPKWTKRALDATKTSRTYQPVDQTRTMFARQRLRPRSMVVLIPGRSWVGDHFLYIAEFKDE